MNFQEASSGRTSGVIARSTEGIAKGAMGRTPENTFGRLLDKVNGGILEEAPEGTPEKILMKSLQSLLGFLQQFRLRFL